MKVRKPTVRVGAGVELINFHSDLVDDVFRQTSFPNPQYEAIVRYSPWGAPKGVSETLDFSEFTSGGIKTGRGSSSFLSSDLQDEIAKGRYVDNRVYAPVKFPKLLLTLNKEQQTCMERLELALEDNERPFGNLLFLASTAAGKTILQASVSARLGQRTLVLCPTDQIMRAWYADLHKAFGLRANQIGCIRGTKFKIVGPFTLATPQTLGRREERWAEINEQFGTIVIDEIQIITAPRLFQFMQQSPAAYHVGATATQEGRIGVNHHLRAIMGQPLVDLNTYGHDTSTSMRLNDVHLINTDFRFEHQADNINWYELGLALTSDEGRNALIVDNVYKEWLEGRVIIVVTKLREHVEVLMQMLQEIGVSNVNRLTGSTNAMNFYTKRLLKAIEQRKVTCIVATQQAIKIGANIPALDSLHIVIPPANKRDFEQLIGRIRRKAQGKTEASVTYYMDTKVGYMMHLYRRIVLPTFQKLKLPGFEV